MSSFYVTGKVKKKKKTFLVVIYLVVIRIKEVPAIAANLEAAGGVHLARCLHMDV